MKIKPEDYEQLKAAMAKVAKQYPIANYRDLAPSFSETRIAWDYFWAANGRACEISNRLYKYLNDSHIDTAVRRIITELEKTQ